MLLQNKHHSFYHDLSAGSYSSRMRETMAQLGELNDDRSMNESDFLNLTRHTYGRQQRY